MLKWLDTLVTINHTSLVMTYQIVSTLEDATVTLFKWFFGNQMNENPEECLLPLNKDRRKQTNIGKNIGSSKCEKLLGIDSDSELNFEALNS